MASVSAYRTLIRWRDSDVETLADIVGEGLDVLFVGLNPSPVSVAKGHYHQGRLGQQFWKLLVHHGILPRPGPGQFHDQLLLANRFGITDIVKVPSPRADSLRPEDIAYGRQLLLEKIRRFGPKIVCSVYKAAMGNLLDTSLKNQWGLLKPRIEQSLVFILPFPYRPADELDVHMRGLQTLINQVRDA